MSARARRLCLAAFVPFALVACEHTPAVSPSSASRGGAGLSPGAPAPELKARWRREGATLVGPAVSGGTLVLLGGRRVLVAEDGKATPEPVPVPEPLLGFLELPGEDGAPRLVAHSAHSVYRLYRDHPLAEPLELLRVSEGAEITALGAGPGAVAVWRSGSPEPTFVEVDTPRRHVMPPQPALPMKAVAFRNRKEGACLFEALGLHVTVDGGAHWDVVPAAQTVAVKGLRLGQSGDLMAVLQGDGLAPIDLQKASLGDVQRPPEAAEKRPSGAATPRSPVLRWIDEGNGDPLVEAIERGVLLPGGEALVPGKHLLARVDLGTGLVVQVERVVDSSELGDFTLAAGGGATWLTRRSEYIESAKAADHTLHLLALRDGSFQPFGPPMLHVGEFATVHAAPSGAVMVDRSCDPLGAEFAVCARQPKNEGWRTLYPKGHHGLGPLLDGSVVYLRGLSPNESPPPDQIPAGEQRPEPGLDDDEPPRSGDFLTWITKVDGCGERTIGILEWPSAERVSVDVLSPITEDASGRLHVLLQPTYGSPAVAIVPPGAGPVKVEPVAVTGAATAKLRVPYGIAVGGKALLRESKDGGERWAPVEGLPDGLRPRLVEIERARIFGSRFKRALPDEDFAVSEVGLRVKPFFRIGWGPSEPVPVAVPSGAVAVTSPTPAVSTGVPSLRCSKDLGVSAGNLPGVGPRVDENEFLWKGLPSHSPAVLREDSRRTGSTGVLGGLLVEGARGSDKPSRWQLAWFDPAEMGAAVRRASLPAPAKTGWGTQMERVAASGARAVFAISPDILVRASTSGVVTRRLPRSLWPRGDAAFGATDRDPVAWVTRVDARSGSRVVVWEGSSEPREMASFVPGADIEVAVGQPRNDRVPVMVFAPAWAAIKTFEVAPRPPNVSPSQPLDGWTRLGFSRQTLPELPPCEKNAPGDPIVVRVDHGGSIELPTGTLWMHDVAYDLRRSGESACIAGVSAILGSTRDRRPSSFLVTDFVRYDVVANKAERVTRDPASVRRMTCELPAVFADAPATRP